MLQQAELSHYHATEEERRKWERREQRLEEELRAAKAEGSQNVDVVTTTRLATAEEELWDKTSQLECSEALRRELLREGDAMRRDNLELKELRAELAMLRARQQRLEALRQEVQSGAQLGGEGHQER